MFVSDNFASDRLSTASALSSVQFAPSPTLPLGKYTTVVVYGKHQCHYYYYHSFSVTVLGGCRSHGCHGYAPRLARVTCGPSDRS